MDKFERLGVLVFVFVVVVFVVVVVSFSVEENRLWTSSTGDGSKQLYGEEKIEFLRKRNVKFFLKERKTEISGLSRCRIPSLPSSFFCSFR